MKITKILGLALAAVLAMSLTSTVRAGTLTSVTLTQSNPTENTSGNEHTIQMTAAQSTQIHEIDLKYCTRASTDSPATEPVGVVSGNCTSPGGTFALSSGNNGTPAKWAGMTTAANTPVITSTGNLSQIVLGTDYDPSGGNSQFTISMGGVTNPTINSADVDSYHTTCVGAGVGASSSTCYIRITTLDTNSVPIDTVTISYSVVAKVTVSATVDPSFSFTVTGVNAGTNLAAYGAGAGIVSSVGSAYNTLPFGSLQAEFSKYAAHKLSVKTNTQSGYTVDVILTNSISGVYGGNVIAPFAGNAGYVDGAVPDGSATAWAGGGNNWRVPPAVNVTKNVNTGWFGAHIQTGLVAGSNAGPSAIGKYAGIATGQVYPVKDSTTADAGLAATDTYVTFAIATNINQPADTYTGTMVYNALPKY